MALLLRRAPVHGRRQFQTASVDTRNYSNIYTATKFDYRCFGAQAVLTEIAGCAEESRDKASRGTFQTVPASYPVNSRDNTRRYRLNNHYTTIEHTVFCDVVQCGTNFPNSWKSSTSLSNGRSSFWKQYKSTGEVNNVKILYTQYRCGPVSTGNMFQYRIPNAIYVYIYNVRGTRWRSGWGTARQTGWSRDRFPMVSLEFFIDIIFRPHYGPGVDLASNRNEYQKYFLGVKAAGA
jgi:hypothetical protein